MHSSWLLCLHTIYEKNEEPLTTKPHFFRFSSSFPTRTFHSLLLDIRLVTVMLQIAHSSTQEKSGVKSERSRWPELGLRWILADGQPFILERLPFCPSSWRAAALMFKASQLPPLIHPQQTLQLKGEDREMLIEDSKLMSPSVILSVDSNFFALDVEGIANRDVDTHIRHQGILKADVKMDVSIWSALPEDIIEKVLARLPLTSVLRFRSVCRRWNSVLLSGSFLSSHSKSSLHRHPCFLLCTIGQFACSFDLSLGKWLTLLKPTSPGASVVTSTGSLLCLGNQVTECRVLSVCNPITRSLRHLPAMRRLCLIHKITMFEDPSTNAYRIVVAGEEGLPTPNPHNFNLITEVYNSNSNEWCTAADPPPEAMFGSDPGVWFEGTFHCLTERPYGIVKFCAEAGVWEEVRVVMPPSLTMPSLVTVKNRLLMVGRCSPRRVTTIHIWELNRSSKQTSKSEDHEDVVLNKGQAGAGYEYEWVEVLEMPRSISSTFLAPLVSYSPFVCAGVGSSIFITTHLSPKVLVAEMGMHGTNGAAAQWSWLPQDPLFPKQRDSHLLGFSFEPRFDASP